MFLDFIWGLLGRIVFFTGTIGTKNSFPKPLTKEQEEYYLQMVAEGDKEAKEVLIRHNMRLVAHIVKKYYSSAIAFGLYLIIPLFERAIKSSIVLFSTLSSNSASTFLQASETLSPLW